MIRYRYKLADGSETFAATASMALLHWLFRERPKGSLPEQPECFVLYQIGQPVEGPYDSLFLVHIVSCIERKFGVTPEVVPEELLQSDWYDNLRKGIDYDHFFVLLALENDDPNVKYYERVCLEVLRWLQANDEFVFLEIENG